MKPFVVFSLLLALLAVAPAAKNSYKKVTRNRITALTEGKVDEVIAETKKILEKDPEELEARFLLAGALAQKGDITNAMEVVYEAIEKGLPVARFVAGPRDLYQPLVDSAPFKTLASKHELDLLHGPQLGSITDSRVRFWMRTRDAVELDVRVGVDSNLTDAASFKGRTSPEMDYTVRIEALALKPDTAYFYQVRLGEKALTDIRTFRTLPPTGNPGKFKIAFGGGAGFNPQYERMWNVIDSYRFAAFFGLGDNVYIDTPLVRQTQQYCYYRRQSRPEWRRLTGSTPVFAIWDDHDFYANDGHGFETYPEGWRLPVLETFKNNWNNPSYGLGEEAPGCFFKTSIADVDFFFLDGRFYRRPAKEVHLGDAQTAWLHKGLKNSKAAFKVICSNVPITPKVKPGSKDTWDGFPGEREALFAFIEKEKVNGVFVIAADRHRSDAWKNEREKGYPIYEFQSSRLSNVHTHKIMPGCLFGYNEKCSFGRLTFDTTKDDPEVTYDIINIDNEKMHSLTLKKSELTHP